MLEAQTVGRQLERLKIEQEPSKLKGEQQVQHLQATFSELLAVSPSTLIRPTGSGDAEQEAAMWDAFAEVYEAELAALARQQGSSSGNLGSGSNLGSSPTAELPTDKKRQVLADILVWAEITQAHYDNNTASFVTAPHGGDASFQRIGRLLKDAKQRRGLS